MTVSNFSRKWDRRTGQEALVCLTGAGLLAFAMRFAFGVMQLIREGSESTAKYKCGRIQISQTESANARTFCVRPRK
jgi:hypothetical protein